MVDASKYVVMDVETNGLSSRTDDLLSISIYRPDIGKEYTKFLPLEKNSEIVTTHINGITVNTLNGAKPLTQNEVKELIQEFELDKRIILSYGNLDEKFINRYFCEHKLTGNEDFRFYNFKRNILSDSFTTGLTKDYFCSFFGIENVTDIHSGINDCILEWKLFEMLDNQIHLVTGQYKFIKMNDDFMMPVSYLGSYNNIKYHITLPRLELTHELLYSYEISLDDIIQEERGYQFKEVLLSLLNAKRQDNTYFYKENSNKVKYLGELQKKYTKERRAYVGLDGEISFKPFDYSLEYVDCENADVLADTLGELVDCLRKNVFKSDEIMYEELVINKEDKVMALCDLSSENSVVDIYGANYVWDKYIYPMYYKANGRDMYIIKTNWWKYTAWGAESINFDVYRIYLLQTETETCFEKQKREAKEKLQQKLDGFDIEIVSYLNNKEKMTVRCKKCNLVFTRFPKSIRNSLTEPCPYCRKV